MEIWSAYYNTVPLFYLEIPQTYVIGHPRLRSVYLLCVGQEI
jgi:hypothetical protein